MRTFSWKGGMKERVSFFHETWMDRSTAQRREALSLANTFLVSLVGRQIQQLCARGLNTITHAVMTTISCDRAAKCFCVYYKDADWGS